MDLSQWEIVEKNYEDIRFGSIDIYVNNNQGQQLIMVKNILCETDAKFLRLFKIYQSLFNDKPKNVLNLKQIQTDRETKIIILYFPYPNFDLYDRQVELQNSEEILKFLYESINALNYYDQNDQQHFNIKPEFFYYDSQQQQYILLPCFNFNQNYKQFLKQQIQENQNIFWSPELFSNFNKENIQWKVNTQNVFSIGIIVLTVLVEIDVIQQIYDINNFQFNEFLFNNIKLVVDRKIFQEEQFQLLSQFFFDRVLTLDPQKRESPQNILKRLEKLIKEISINDIKQSSKFQSQKNIKNSSIISNGEIEEEEHLRPKTQHKKRQSGKIVEMSFGNLQQQQLENSQMNKSKFDQTITENTSTLSPNLTKQDTQSQIQNQQTQEKWPYQIESKIDNQSDSNFSFDFENNTQKFSENQDFIEQMMQEHKSQDNNDWFNNKNDVPLENSKLQFNENIAKQIDQEKDFVDKGLFETAGFEKKQVFVDQLGLSNQQIDETFDSIIQSRCNENSINSIQEDNNIKDNDSQELNSLKIKNQFTKKNDQNIQVQEYYNSESKKEDFFDVTPYNEIKDKQNKLNKQWFNLESEELQFRSLQQKQFFENFIEFFKEILISINFKSFQKFLHRNQIKNQQHLKTWKDNQKKFLENFKIQQQQFEQQKLYDIKEVYQVIQNNLQKICDLTEKDIQIELFFQEMLKFCSQKYLQFQQNYQSLNYSENQDKKKQSVQNYYFMQSGYTSKFNSQQDIQFENNTQQSQFDNEKFTELNMKVNQSSEQLSYPKTSDKKTITNKQNEDDFQYQQIEDSKEELFFQQNKQIFKKENLKILNLAQKLQNSKKNFNQDPQIIFPNIYDKNQQQYHSEKTKKQDQNNQKKQFKSEKFINNVFLKQQQPQFYTDQQPKQNLQNDFDQFNGQPCQQNIKQLIKPYQSDQKIKIQNKQQRHNNTIKLNKAINTSQSLQQQPKYFMQFVEFLNQSQFNFQIENYINHSELNCDKFFMDFIDQINQKKSSGYQKECFYNYFVKHKLKQNLSFQQQKIFIEQQVFESILQVKINRKKKQQQFKQKDFNILQHLITNNKIQNKKNLLKPLLQYQQLPRIFINKSNHQNEYDIDSEIESKNQTIKIKFKPSFSQFIIIKKNTKKIKTKNTISQSLQIINYYENTYQKNRKKEQQEHLIQNDLKQSQDHSNKFALEKKNYIQVQNLNQQQQRYQTPDLEQKQKNDNSINFLAKQPSKQFLFSQEIPQYQNEIQKYQKLSQIIKSNLNDNKNQENQRNIQIRQKRLSTRSVDIHLQKNKKNYETLNIRQSQYEPRNQIKRFGSKSPVRITKYTEQQFKNLNKDHQKQFKQSIQRPGISVDRNKVYQQIQNINKQKRPQQSPLPFKNQPFSISQHIENQTNIEFPLEQTFNQNKKIQSIQQTINKNPFISIKEQNFNFESNKKIQPKKLLSQRIDLPLKESLNSQKGFNSKQNKRRNQKVKINIDLVQKDTYQKIVDEKDDDTLSMISGYRD